MGGVIGLVQNGDLIQIDAETNTIQVHVSDAELEKRKSTWQAPPLKAGSGALYKYAHCVSTASKGCTTDEI